MVRASAEHERTNGEQYQQWDVPVGQDTSAVNVGRFHVLSTLTGDSSARSSLALAPIVIELNHT